MSGPGGGGGGGVGSGGAGSAICGTGVNRMKSSPKQGPLKATIPISSVTKEGSSLRNSTSPTIMANKFGQVGDIGRNSPNSTHYIEGKQCNIGSTIRRTASLDTIYLRGLFPKDGFYWHRDRSTQTDISNSLDSLQILNSDEKFSRLSVRARRRSISRDSPNDQNTATQTTLVPSGPKANQPKSSRSSEEGLNQEIEGIILRSESYPQCSDRLRQPTPEGRKAPVADLLKYKVSTNTQTLVGSLVTSANIVSYQQDAPQSDSSPIAGCLDTPHSETEESQGSSPDQERMNASPRINKFLERPPPDGCERVPLKKSIPLVKPIPLQPVVQPQATNFTLKPSSGSAFQTLNRSEGSDDGDEQDKEEIKKDVLPIVPAIDQQDLS